MKEIASGHINSSEYQEFLENYHSLFNNPASELRTKISQIESMVQEVFTSQFGVANISFSFDELQIENFFKTANIVIDDGVSVPMSEKGHGMQRAVALSLLQVYAQIASAPDDSSVPKPFYFFIDEPELCLHPLGQKKLLDAFMVISQNRQVFVTTHSPFMLSSPNLVNAGLFICTKTGEVSSVVSANSQPMFPWSPSWGEITYRAYNLATVDLHNELYGYIQEKHTLPRIADVDQWLNGHGVANSKQWTIERNGNPGQTIATTLQSFIRNHIHHPENVTMQSNRYSDSDLQQSIEQMITLL